jgi:3-deoxy-D-manno-octulosonate 8-phosphate phosphatase (KDO 8-P phosphatase)
MRKGAEILSRPPARGSTAARARDLEARLKRVRLFLCDVDGVLTDGTVFMAGETESKQFNILDGLGLRFLQREGIKVGWVSGRASPATTQRAKDLRVDFLSQGSHQKVPEIETILGQAGVTWEQLCYVGDDVLDLGALKRAGLAVAVANAIAECQALAHYVTRNSGGRGAIREVVDLILKAQGRWAALVEGYSK